MRLPSLVAIMVALPGLAFAERYVDRTGITGAIRGPAEAAIWATVSQKTRDCIDPSGKAFTCAILDNDLSSDIIYGESPIREQLAFVSVLWQPDTRGNAVENRGFVFLKVGRGYRLVAEGVIPGETITAIQFASGRVSVVSEGPSRGRLDEAAANAHNQAFPYESLPETSGKRN